eukprot:7846028-Karenia_brevis.AAC.1
MEKADPRAKENLISEQEVGEVFCWHHIGEHLRILGYTDWRVFTNPRHSFKTGVRLGPGVVGPRVPVLSNRKVRWHKYDGMGSDELPLSKDNDGSA